MLGLLIISLVAVFPLPKAYAGLNTDGSASNALATGTSISVTLTTTQPSDVVIVLLSSHNGGFFPTISDGTHTYTVRKNSVVSFWAQEVYAIWSVAGTYTITASGNGGGENAMVAFGISGADTNSPFDSNAALPAVGGCGGTSSCTVTISTSNANDMILNEPAINAGGCSGTFTPASGFSLIVTATLSGQDIQEGEDKVVSATQSSVGVTSTYSCGFTFWNIIVDAVKEAPPAPPNPPRNLVATSSALREITLTWLSPSGGGAPTGYKVYRGTSSGGESLLATLGVILTYVDSALTCGTLYFYKVTAFNTGGESGYSNEANMTAYCTPSTPQAINISTLNTALFVQWKAPAVNASSVQGYRIWRSTSSGSETLYISIGNVLKFKDVNATCTFTFYYKVQAFNPVFNSSLTSEVSSHDLCEVTLGDMSFEVIAGLGLGIVAFSVGIVALVRSDRRSDRRR